MNIRKAVVPAAGFGTRFLPATRTVPKVMLPALDTPALHLVVEEAVQAGIEQVAVVISQQQDAIGNYFGRLSDLERALQKRGDSALLERMTAISEMVEVRVVYQPQQLGLGHAVLMTKEFVDGEPFAVLLPDDLIWSDAPTIGRMIEVFNRYEGSVIAVEEVEDERVPSLGIIDPKPIDERVSQVFGMVEKPSLDEAPSNLAIIGRYVLAADVFDAIERVKPGAVGEIQLTDAIAGLLSAHRVYAYHFPGVHIDVGTPLGLLKASIYAALGREDLAPDLRSWLTDHLDRGDT